mmetsp:Transcript_123181/g.184222  ORF Transcript_123181/g.184222 Transcript_123181/m.184222 type:complete len:226 (-) Transcript_123181:111-788(-)
MSHTPLIVPQLAPTLFPRGTVTVPHKAHAFQRDDAFVRHGRRLAFVLELVLVSLAFDPTSERGVFLEGVRNAAVAAFLLEVHEFSKLFGPLFGLIVTEAFALVFVVLFRCCCGGSRRRGSQVVLWCKGGGRLSHSYCYKCRRRGKRSRTGSLLLEGGRCQRRDILLMRTLEGIAVAHRGQHAGSAERRWRSRQSAMALRLELLLPHGEEVRLIAEDLIQRVFQQS